MIDIRLPPLTNRVVRVPLYPQKTKLPVIAKIADTNKLAFFFTKKFSCSNYNLILTASASAGLYAYLKQLQRPNTRVALTAFSCQSLIEALVQAGCIPVFTDIGPNVELTIKNAKFVVAQECDFFILPNYFGSRKSPEHVIRILEQGNVKIILDEAQSFTVLNKNVNPSDYDRYTLVLFSFGLSKGVAGTGGGLLYMAKPDKLFKSVKRLIDHEQPFRGGYYGRLKNVLLELAYLWSPKLIIMLGLKGKFYDRLDLLIEESPIFEFTKIGIYPIDAKVAYKNLKNQLRAGSKYESDWNDLKDALMNKLGENSLSFLDKISGVPNIVAICVNPLERYQLLYKLSLNNIQSTWYYYPMSDIKRYSCYKSETLVNTPKISSSIVILPFQWQHSMSQRKRLIRVIKELDIQQDEV